MGDSASTAACESDAARGSGGGCSAVDKRLRVAGLAGDAGSEAEVNLVADIGGATAAADLRRILFF